MTSDATDGRGWICLDFKTGANFRILHFAFCIHPALCGGWRGWKETKWAAVIFDSEGVGTVSLRKGMALGWAASASANHSSRQLWRRVAIIKN